jgi:hypothetical protein
MFSNSLSAVTIRTLSSLLAVFFLSAVTFAQLAASPPIADPTASDPRFLDTQEDLATPLLTSSHLQPVAPPASFLTDYTTYTVELLQLQWRPGDPLDLYVMKPKGVKNPPVILNLYGYPADTDPYKNEVFQRTLVQGGFAAVGFVSALTGHRYHDRPMKEWFLSELQESLAKSAHDVQMILDYLAARGDLDMNRVGMFGQGSGATIAILASGADPRIKVLDVLDPWNDWPVWMATSPFVPDDERADYVKPEFLKKVAGMDPLVWVPKLPARKFRLQQLAFETDTPPAAKEKLRSAVPAGTEVVVYKTLPEFNAAFPNSSNLQWMKCQLQSLPGLH